ncbi:MAG TPA: SDR family NAD(P)-dependent oxidoreductase [Anaerolineales bacterium]|nr:SDR family NAD(P)-dependent oxidoreductase [Anaerolineales bacterium]
METRNPNVYMLTSVTSALGKAIAIGLAKTGGTVLLISPDPEHGTQVEQEIVTASQNPTVEVYLCDIGNLSSVRNLAEILRSKYDKIDVLINNSNVYRSRRTLTVDGYEEMFAANHLGPYLLVRLLEELLRESGVGQVIHIASPTTTELDFDDLQGQRQFNSLKAYHASQMANLLVTQELDRRMQNSGIRVNALHPGLVRSEIRKEASLPVRLLAWLFALSPARAAEEVVRPVTDPEFAQAHGKFFHKGGELEYPAYALDTANQQRLWEISERLTDAADRDPNYDPTGSVAMHKDKDIPAGLIRPQEDPVRTGRQIVEDQ